MDKLEIKKYICPSDFLLIDAMKLIDENSKGILYVTDQEGALIGSITDGDIRRWILKTADLSANVSQFAFKNPRYIKEAEILNADRFMMKEEIRSVPVVDENILNGVGYDLRCRIIMRNPPPCSVNDSSAK